MKVEWKECLINDKWKLWMPKKRADRNKGQEGKQQWSDWEFERLRKCKEIIKPGMTIVDVGSESGDFSTLFSKWVGKEGTVVLMESSHPLWAEAKLIWEKNKAPSKLITFCGYVDKVNANEPALIFDGFPEQANWDYNEGAGFWNMKNFNDKMPRMSLNSLREKIGKIDLVHMDIEGYEYQALLGAINLMKDGTMFVVSIHEDLMKNLYDDWALWILRLFQKNGYRGEWLSIDHEEHWFFWKEPEYYHKMRMR